MRVEIAGQDALIVYFAEQASAAVSAHIQRAVVEINLQMADIAVAMVSSYESSLVIYDTDKCVHL